MSEQIKKRNSVRAPREKKYKIFNKTGYKGISEQRNGTFVAQLALYIQKTGKSYKIHLGTFDTAEEANTFRIKTIAKLF